MKTQYIYRHASEAPDHCLGCKESKDQLKDFPVMYWICVSHGAFFHRKPVWALALERVTPLQ